MFIDKIIGERTEPKEEEIEKFELKLEIIFDLFIQDLKSKEEFSDMKNDYISGI